MPKRLVKIERSFFGIKIPEKGIYKAHPLQEYLLEEYPNGKEVTILWRTCPIQKEESVLDKEQQKHIGEYWYRIKYLEPTDFGFQEVKRQKTFYFKSLKELKKAINKEFTKRGFYPVYKVK